MKSIRFLVLSFLVGLLIIVVGPDAKSISRSSTDWGYNGATGPSSWGELSSEFATCKQGLQQSPVDLKSTASANLPPIEFNYKYTPFKVINNGHTLQVEYAPGSSIALAGKQYELLQFHFHAPSEHSIDGKTYPIEAHLVHKSQDGKLAVIGIFMKEGRENSFIQALWSNLPESEGENQVRGISINASAMPPANKSYYNYPGSLTTPPCSEGVNWIVLKTPIEVSQEQIDAFKSIYNGNARPVQPLNSREIQVN